jgi:hypothetical protein
MPLIGGSCIGFLPMKKNSMLIERKLLVPSLVTKKNVSNYKGGANKKMFCFPKRSRRNLKNEFK